MPLLPPRISQNVLARNSMAILVGHFLRVAVQAFYFVVIARLLGPDGYGAFAAAVALVAVVSPFSTLGAGNVLVMHVARDQRLLSDYWWNAVGSMMAGGVALGVPVVGLGHLLLPDTVPLSLLVAAAVAELVFTRLVDLSAMAFQAFDRLSITARLPVILSAARLAAAVVLALLPGDATVETWSLLFVGSAALSALVSVATVRSQLDVGRFRWHLKRAEIPRGLAFSVSASAQTVYNDIDKTMLARYATLGTTGIYAAAYRIIEVLVTPITAVLTASYARFFRHGEHGLEETVPFALRLLRYGGLYSVVLAGLIVVSAPALPIVLGPEFGTSVTALQLLAPLPLLKSLHFFAGDALTGAGYQGYRSGMQVGTALANVALNLWLIPAYSWRGAIASTLICEAFLAVSLWFLVGRLRRRQPPAASAARAAKDGTNRPPDDLKIQ